MAFNRFPSWNVSLFERQIATYGQELLHRPVVSCSCSRGGGNQSDCKNCSGAGFYHGSPYQITGLLYENTRNVNFADEGRTVPGTAKLLVKYSVTLSVLDQIISLTAVSAENEIVQIEGEGLSGFTHYDVTCLDYVSYFQDVNSPHVVIPLNRVYWNGRRIVLGRDYRDIGIENISVNYRYNPVWRIDSFLREDHKVLSRVRGDDARFPRHVFLVRYEIPKSEYRDDVQKLLSQSVSVAGRSKSIAVEELKFTPTLTLTPDFTTLAEDDRRRGGSITLHIGTDSGGDITISGDATYVTITKTDRATATVLLLQVTDAVVISVRVAETADYNARTITKELEILHPLTELLPALITDLSSVALNDVQIDLSWTTPDSLSSITGYTLQWSTGDFGDGDSITSISISGDATSYEHTGRMPDTLYYYRIKATNETGFAEYSDSISRRTKITVPGAITDLRVVNHRPREIDIAWTTPESTFPIEGYIIRWSVDNFVVDDNEIRIEDPTITEYAHTLLLIGVIYNYEVHAYNDGGEGLASNVVSTLALTVPGVPTGLTAVAQSTTSILVSWIPPVSDGGHRISRYDVQWHISDDDVQFNDLFVDVDPLLGVDNFIHENLEPDSDYVYRVRAVNEVGTGAPSNVARIHTLARTATTFALVPAMTSISGNVGDSVTLSYTTNSDGIISIGSSDESIFTVTHNMADHTFTLFFVGAGNANVPITIAETATHNPLPENIPVMVEAAALTTQAITLVIRDSANNIVLPAAAMGEIDATFTVTATSDSGLTNFNFSSSNIDIFTVAPVSGTTNQATITLVGVDGAALTNNADLRVTQPGNDTYSQATAIQLFTVSKKSQSIDTGSPAATAIIDNVVTYTASADSGLAVTYTVTTGAGLVTQSGAQFTFSGAGSVVIAVSQAGNTIWALATSVNISVTVLKKTASISFSPTKEDFATTNRVAGTSEVLTITTSHDGTPVVTSDDESVVSLTDPDA